MKEISIIVPIYNTEKYIENFIKSVIQQTFKNFELILINDGSKDKSIEKAENLLKSTNIEYIIINKKNGGQSSARNVGLKEANGNWIVIPDSDDVLQKDYLEIMYNQTKNKNIEVIICDLNNVKDENIFEETIRTNRVEEKIRKKFF